MATAGPAPPAAAGPPPAPAPAAPSGAADAPDPVLAAVEAHVRAALAGRDASHDWAHIARVTATAAALAAEEGLPPARARAAALGALLHDLADWKYAGDPGAAGGGGGAGAAAAEATVRAHGGRNGRLGRQGAAPIAPGARGARVRTRPAARAPVHPRPGAADWPRRGRRHHFHGLRGHHADRWGPLGALLCPGVDVRLRWLRARAPARARPPPRPGPGDPPTTPQLRIPRLQASRTSCPPPAARRHRRS
jgi:hypothetical protein